MRGNGRRARRRGNWPSHAGVHQHLVGLPGRARSGGRRGSRQALLLGVPVIIIGVAAVLVLPDAVGGMGGGRAGVTAAAAGARDATGPLAVLPPGAPGGYPGQHGLVLVSSVTSAGVTRLAVGSADGHPAIWRQQSGGPWLLVSAPAWQAGAMASVAHG